MDRPATILTILVLLALPLTEVYPQIEATTPPGARGPISRERLARLLPNRIDGYVIHGADLLAVITELGDGHRVQISDCIIEGGLQFTGTVAVALAISDCEVRSAPEFIRGPWAGAALYAREVDFTRDLNLIDSRFDGEVVLIGTRFQGKANFAGSELTKGTDFTGTKFADAAHFRNALFKGARFDGAVFQGEANFNKAVFLDGVGLKGTEFQGPARFPRTRFEGEQHIYATFHQRVDFGQAEFTGDAFFSSQAAETQFREEVDFSDANFGGKADFSDVLFSGPLSFKGSNFKDDVNFARTRFNATATFAESEFAGDADFTEAFFAAQADFSPAIFAGRADFDSSEFAGITVFKGAEFQGPGIFVYARFQGPSYFNLSRFNARAVFFDSVMLDEVTFAEAVLGGRADFLRVAFGKRADFSKVQFDDRASFAETIFSGDASFRDGRFQGEAVFRGAAFSGLLDFQNLSAANTIDLASTNYGAYADFRNAHIHSLNVNSAQRPAIVSARFDMRGARLGQAHFEDVIFEDQVDFSDATFGMEGSAQHESATVFRFVTFEKGVSFARTRFSDQLALENVKFQDLADFTDADLSAIAGHSPPGFSLSYVTFSDLVIDWRQLPPPTVWAQGGAQRITTTLETALGETAFKPLEPLSRVFERLEAGFRNHGQLADANAAYYHRKRTELLEARTEGLTWRRLWLEVQWIFWGVTAGYGTKLWWVVGWALLIDLLFTFIYWLGAAIHREPHPEIVREHSLRLRLLDLPKHYLKDKTGRMIRSELVNAFRVSSVILFKVGYRDTSLSGTVGSIKVDHLVRIEWFIGFYVLAMFTVTLANTQPLLNRLITGIF
ncbi:MAG: pentapeptide repeat-containing protein [Candidatus Competibacteraceae bacterium]|nr:pentapeptide repeat-containing protein [Candidatus Competibacteraceae bacterium]